MLWYVLYYAVRRIHYLDQHRVLVILIVSLTLFCTLSEIRAEQSLSFMTGVLLSEYKTQSRKLFTWKVGLSFIVLGTVMLGLKQLGVVREAPQLIFNLVQMSIKLPCALGIIIIAWELSRFISFRFFSMIGTISFELYIIHGYILGLTHATITDAGIFIAASAIAATIYWWIMNRIKPFEMKLLHMN